MNGLYITLINILQPGNLGITKVKGQINAFEKLGCKMDWIYEKDNKIYINNFLIGERSETYKGVNDFFHIIKNFLSKDRIEYDFIYIRYMHLNLGLLSLLKFLKKNNIKVFLEIPTYPYQDEWEEGIKKSLFKMLDKYITIQLNKYVYRIIITNSIKSLFGTKTIEISNSIDSNIVKYIKKNDRDNKDIINIIGLANLTKWHGYDRLIEGLKQYYLKPKEKQVNFYIVGNGNEEVRNSLIDLVNKYKLNKYVFFTGAKVGKDLDELYRDMDIGISSLALFRAGGGHDPVKTKEYLAKGIPVVLGYDDRSVSSNLKFIYKAKEDDSPINIEEMVSWYENINIANKEIAEYAKKNLSWKTQMNKVLISLNEN